MGGVSRKVLQRGLEVLKVRGFVTVAHLVEALGVEPSVASRLYKIIRSYCLAKGSCIESRQVLYNLEVSSEELARFRKEKLGRMGRPESIVYFTLKMLGEGRECVPLDELVHEVLRRVRIPSPYVLESIYKLWSNGLVIERRKTCFKAIE